MKYKIWSIIFILLAVGLSFFVFNESGFKLGLDLKGGTQLVYRADTSLLEDSEVRDSMEALRDVIERRVNLFGVSEPIVQVEETGIFSEESGEQRLIIELPGVTDIDEATKLIGETPLLAFYEETGEVEPEELSLLIQTLIQANETKIALPEEIIEAFNIAYKPTDLTGAFLSGSQLQFIGGGGSGFGIQEPIVELNFNSEGADLFESITRENVGKTVAIYLDGAPISAPRVSETISGGTAVISGNFTPEEAKTLVGRLNSGALPVPIELIATQNVGATLGANALERGIDAGLMGLVVVTLFIILWYRLPGFLAILSLAVYLIILMSIMKVFGVTLTAAGIAGIILSVGMAVDANVLIFERMKEELRDGKPLESAIPDGFSRAWASIRDANISSIITAAVLFWFGTSLIQGFALTFGLGVLVSMFSAIVITRVFILALNPKGEATFLFKNGFANSTKTEAQ